MHDIKFIKDNGPFFDDKLKKRNLPPISKILISLHNEYLEELKKVQTLQEKKNTLSKKFSSVSQKKEIEEIRYEVSQIKLKLDDSKKKNEKLKKNLDEHLLSIPNLVDNKTPLGISSDENKIIKTIGSKKKFDFKIKDHVELAEKLNFLDYNKASKLSGARFSIIRSQLASMYRALANFMLDINVNDFNYEEYILPELIKEECLVGTGQLPKFGDDLFKVDFNDLWLIPTAEVPLTNLYRNDIIDSRSLPLRFTSFTNCFRSEAGAAGKDTKGLMREHQFGKVEIVSITKPQDSMSELNRMTKCIESILTKLNLPYRLVELCTGDIGFSSSYTIDFEVWMPGQKKYREVSSCSNCKDFQSRRMKMRVRDKQTGETFFPHTLNASSIAIGRILISIIENFQQSNGSILVPEALRPYMSATKIIGNL